MAETTKKDVKTKRVTGVSVGTLVAINGLKYKKGVKTKRVTGVSVGTLVAINGRDYRKSVKTKRFLHPEHLGSFIDVFSVKDKRCSG